MRAIWGTKQALLAQKICEKGNNGIILIGKKSVRGCKLHQRNALLFSKENGQCSASTPEKKSQALFCRIKQGRVSTITWSCRKLNRLSGWWTIPIRPQRIRVSLTLRKRCGVRKKKTRRSTNNRHPNTCITAAINPGKKKKRTSWFTFIKRTAASWRRWS